MDAVSFPHLQSNADLFSASLAYNPEKKHLVLAESKVRGRKRSVIAYTSYTRKEYGSFFEFDKSNGKDYLSFIRHIELLCRNGSVFQDFQKMVKKLTVQLVSNYAISKEQRPLVVAEIQQNLDALRLPVKPEFRIDTTLDVITRVISKEKMYEQGRRYGHPILDMVREMNRYFSPSLKYAADNKKDREAVKSEMVSAFLEAVSSGNMCSRSENQP